MFKKALAISFIASQLMISSHLFAEEDRSAVLERIKPVGTVTIEGQEMVVTEAAPAAPAAAPAEAAPAAAPAMEAVAEVAAAAPAPAAAADGQAIYNQACLACHMTGAAGAPKLGDAAAWAPRIATGKDALLSSAINGKGAMPPKGGQVQLSDAEISAAVDYMVANSQ